MTVESNAAICRLTVKESVWKKDVVLQILMKCASCKQLTVFVEKKAKKDYELEVSSSRTFYQRNAILRAICGISLHNALDQSPYYLLGGASESIHVKSNSNYSVMILSSISSWMSLASTIGSDNTDTICQDLDSYLSKQAFLTNHTASPTIADLDVAFTLLPLIQSSDADYPNLSRWMRQCHATAHQFSYITIDNERPTLTFTDVPSLPENMLAGPSKPIQFCFPSITGTTATVAPTPTTANKSQGEEGGKKELTEEEKKAVAEKRANAKKEKESKKKQKQPAAPSKQTDKKNTSGGDELDISALDIRVGVIKKVWEHPEADKLFCEEIDVGEDKVRSIASGLRPFYKPEQMLNQKVMVLCNLKARTMLGFPSHGMVLCASNEDHTKVEFAIPPEDAPIGERVTFTSVKMNDPEPENKVAKKKMLEKLLPDFKTNASGMVYWKDEQQTATTTKGPCKAINSMPNAHVA